MDSKIRREVVRVIRQPSEMEVVNFVTSDSKKFSYESWAQEHQAVLDSKEALKSLTKHDDWTFVHSIEDVQNLFYVASQGRYSGRDSYIPFPAWVRVSAYQDNNNYWNTTCDYLSRSDLKQMLEAFPTDEQEDEDP